MEELTKENLSAFEMGIMNLKEAAIAFAPTFISAIVSALFILILGIWLIRLINRILKRIFEKKDVNISVQNFLSTLVNWTLRILLFIIVVSKLGVPTSTFIAIIGAAGLAIGLSLQGSLSNFAGGVLILAFKPFKVGDYISASNGVAGTVSVIDVFNTKLTTPQNQLVVVPNGELSNSSITNFTELKVRRTWFNIGVSYNTDLNKAKDLLLKTVEAHPSAMKDPAPAIVVTEITANSINLSIRATATNEKFWAMQEDLIIQCKAVLDEAGIDIPYPQRIMHMKEIKES